MAESVLKRLKEEIPVMSAAMGTMMAKMGADLSGYIGQWIVEHPGFPGICSGIIFG